MRFLSAAPLFLSSLLYVLAFPKFNLSWLSWVALVPLASFSRRASARRAFLSGWLSGTLAYAGILYWIIITFQAAHLSLALACACLVLLSAYLGLFWGAWAWYLSSVDGRGAPLLHAWGGAAAWVALEYLRTYLFSGFPWALLADSRVNDLGLIQIASVTGSYGVSFLLVLANLAVEQVFSRFVHHLHDEKVTRLAWRRLPAVMAPTALLITGCYVFGIYRLHHGYSRAPEKSFKVVLLQGNIDQYKKWDKTFVRDIENTYEDLCKEATLQNPRLIIWPETSVPGYLLQDERLRTWLLKLIRHSRTYHIVGSPSMRANMAYNTAFSISPEGIIEGQYSKKHLVPFGEVVPWSKVLGRFIKALNELGGFAAGTEPPVIRIDGIRVGINICYEAIFPALVRQSVQDGAEIIANLTNDGWYMQTAAPYQHLAPNIYRAVENARWVVRANNTGITAMIDPQGHLRESIPIFTQGMVIGQVERLNGLTFYSRWGDWFAILCSIAVIGIILFRPRWSHD